MDAYSLAAVGATFDGKPGFILLADRRIARRRRPRRGSCRITIARSRNRRRELKRSRCAAKWRDFCFSSSADRAIAPIWRTRAPGGERCRHAYPIETLPCARRHVCDAEPGLRVRACRRRPVVADHERPLRFGRSSRLAHILRKEGSRDAARRLPAAGAVRHGAFVQVRQCADAARDLLLRTIRDSRHERGGLSRPSGLARMHPPCAGETPRFFLLWSSRKAPKSASSDRPTAGWRAAVLVRIPRSPTRRSAAP